MLPPQVWIERTNAKGLISKSGRYGGGTYAHHDIAFEFASWVSVEFKLYLITDYQRLKVEEQKQLGWSVKRELSKINYRIHTDAIKTNLIPLAVSRPAPNRAPHRGAKYDIILIARGGENPVAAALERRVEQAVTERTKLAENAANENRVALVPRAAMLLESMRDIGYTFESAVADLVDNSISATRANRLVSYVLNPVAARHCVFGADDEEGDEE